MKILIVDYNNPRRYTKKDLANADLVLIWNRIGSTPYFYCVKDRHGKLSHDTMPRNRLLDTIDAHFIGGGK